MAEQGRVGLERRRAVDKQEQGVDLITRPSASGSSARRPASTATAIWSAGAALPAGLRRAAQRGGGDTAPTPLQYLLFGAAT
jgi:hypothetical protein